MARKPKTQPSVEVAAPTRRGRKLKAAAPSPELPLAADVGGPAAYGAGAAVSNAAPTKVPGRRGSDPKPKQAAGVKIASAVSENASASQGQATYQPEAEASLDLTEADAPTAAAASQAEAAADSDPVQPNRDFAELTDEAAQSVPEAEASVPAAPAARWDRVTDRVQFDWPTIERVAAQDGPNQAMAKLLVAARAEGAQSRWPF